jgi:hypothetical protein
MFHTLAGNAFQRALAFEQLGAPETFDLAGVDWRARLLLESLDDLYEANRYLAYRALQKMPGFEDYAYDYIAPEAERAKQIADAKQRWQNQVNQSKLDRLRSLLGGDAAGNSAAGNSTAGNSAAGNVDELIGRLKNQRPSVAIEIME